MTGYKECALLLFVLLFAVSGCSDSNSGSQLTTDSSPAEGGTVSPEKGIYSTGDQIEITARPAEGYLFDYWRGDLPGSDNPATVTMDQDRHIIAVFRKKEYPLNIAISGSGSVNETIVEEKNTDYKHGTVVQLTAQSNEGWVFDRWTDELSGTENPVTITVDSEKTVGAVFVQLSKEISGKVTFRFDAGNWPVKDALVSASDSRTRTDEEGYFSLMAPLSTDSIRVSADYMNTYVSEFDAEQTDPHNITLQPVHAEMFPLALNNRWTYKHSGFKNGGSRETTGIREQVIFRTEVHDPDTLFYFETTFRETTYAVSGDGTQPHDTLFATTVDTALVRKNQDNRLIIESEKGPFFWIKEYVADVNYSYPLYSHYPQYLINETGQYDDVLYARGGDNYPPYIKIKKDTGIVSYEHSVGGVHHDSREDYHLISFDQEE